MTPNDPFPDVSGSYNIAGGFDGLSNSAASFTGSLTLTQASAESGTLSGTMSATLTLDGDVTTVGSVPIQSASVTPNGTVSFQLRSIGNGASWTFTGTAAGEAITGRHTLTDGSNTFSGDWTASKGSLGTGNLTVTATTTGSTLDPDGYTLIVDGAGRGTLNGSSPITISGLAAGNHSVGLDGVADNCQVTGDNPVLASISSGATASVSFSVTCTTPQASPGAIQVNTTTTGSDVDPDGYLATLDGAGPGVAVAATGSVTFPSVAAGNHTVALSGLASNCSVAGETSIATTVASGATSQVSFTVNCLPIPPTTGVLQVVTATNGPDQDADGYRFRVDGGRAQSIEANAQVDLANTPAGSHTVALSGVASNCSVADGASKTVSVTGGQTADAAFSITCTALGPSASQSTVVAASKTLAAGSGSSAITVTVRNANGALLAGVPVSLNATGSDNTITPESATTDASGVATFTFSSTTAGAKTITATAGGVTLSHTEGITVVTNASTTTITSIDPESSVAGESISVTVTVTGEGGGTPTGTVAVFSEQETGGCDAAPLDSKGVATCDFPLNVVGTQNIEATYSGDGAFEESSDPDGQQHVVNASVTTAGSR